METLVPFHEAGGQHRSHCPNNPAVILLRDEPPDSLRPLLGHVISCGNPD